MSEEVGVDVQRLEELASALENLRNVLAVNVPTIASIMNGYWSAGTGSPISLQPLQQAQGHSVDDATDIRDRAIMATAYLNRPNAQLLGNFVEIPWYASQQLNEASSAAAAEELAAAEAEASKDPAAARVEIGAIEADMQYNLDAKNTAWIQDFYDNGGAAAAANLAQTLHDLDTPGKGQDYADRFQVLTSADEKTLATFANGLAIADKAGLSAQAVQSLVSSPDMWSTAMLIKYGPPGSSWATSEPTSAQNPHGASLLALLTQAAYRDTESGKISVPVGFGARYGQQDMSRLQAILGSNDPLQVLMSADTQNKDAAWQVMGGPDGDALAQMLLSSQHGDPVPQIDGRFAQVLGSDGQYTGTFKLIPPGEAVPEQDQDGAVFVNTPDQNVVGAFLDASTSAPRGGGPAYSPAWYSAHAALNIIENTQPPVLGAGTVQPGYDPAIIKALMDTFARYMPDIAYSDRQGGGPSVALQTNSAGQVDGGYTLLLPPRDLPSFLQEICSTPADYAIVKGAVASAAGTALALQLKGITANGTDPYHDLTYLYGALIAQNGNLHYSSEVIKDNYDTQLNAEIAFGENFIKDIPVVGNAASTLLTYDQQLSALGVPQIPQFSTDNASAAAAAATAEMNRSELMAEVPIVQGLAQGGVSIYTKEDGWQSVQATGTKEGWYVDGKVVPNTNFWKWLGGSGGAYLQDQSAPGATYSTLDDEYQDFLNWMRLGQSENNQIS
jgi:hypothetical protein